MDKTDQDFLISRIDDLGSKYAKNPSSIRDHKQNRLILFTCSEILDDYFSRK